MRQVFCPSWKRQILRIIVGQTYIAEKETKTTLR